MPQLAQEIQPVHAGHVQVQQNGVHRTRAHQFQRLAPVARAPGATKAVRILQIHFQGDAVARFVVRQQHPYRRTLFFVRMAHTRLPFSFLVGSPRRSAAPFAEGRGAYVVQDVARAARLHRIFIQIAQQKQYPLARLIHLAHHARVLHGAQAVQPLDENADGRGAFSSTVRP